MIVPSTAPTTVPQNTTQTPPSQTADKNGFLKLLIAQLQNQDPLQPMDNQQFAVQLATFNSLEQLIDINKSLGALQSTQTQTNQFNATSLIGKEIDSSGNSLSLQTGGSTSVNYQLTGNATKVVINIMDSNGSLVRQLQFGAQKAGDQQISWDGKDAAGKSAAGGNYTFEVNAFDLNGKQVAASGRTRGTVTGV